MLVSPPGIMTVRGHMQGWIRASLERVIARLVLREWLEDDRSSTFESVDFARDVSFRAVLDLIRKFHDMGEPATVPAARCKTSLASAFGLPTDSSPSFALPLSPLLSTLLMDIKLGFVQVYGGPDRARVSSCARSPTTEVLRHLHLLFPGPYTVPPGLSSITMEKASEVRKRSVSLSASQVSSLETMLSGMCEVASWMDWWLSTCGGLPRSSSSRIPCGF